MRDLTRLFQPSGEPHFGLGMSCNSTFSDSLLAASDAFKYGHTLQHQFIALNVYQVGAWQPVLSDEDGLFVALDIREEFSGLTL